MTRLALLLFSATAIAHPGHGALEAHWHVEDLIWLLIAAVVVSGAAYFINRKKKP